MVIENCCVAVFDRLPGVQAATQVFDTADCRLSIVGCCRERGAVAGCRYMDGRLEFVGDEAGIWGDLRERFPDTALLRVEPLGMVIVVGSLVGGLVAVIEEREVTSADSFLGELFYRINIPRESIVRYEAALREAYYLVVIQGCQDDVSHAHDLLSNESATDLAIHLG